MKGFPASFPAVCTKKSTPFQINSEKECLDGFGNWDVRQTLYAENRLRFVVKIRDFPHVISTGSIQLRASRDVVIHHQKMELLLAVFLVHRGQKHAAGVDAHHGSRREIRDGNQGLSDQLFRLVICVNTA